MNVLITSIGSMAADFVIQSIKKMGFQSIGVDIYSENWLSNSNEVDFFYQVVPVSDKENYLKSIIKICEHHQVELIIPLTDLDVDFFSENKVFFNNSNVTITISEEEIVKIVRDKLEIYNVFKDSKINVIPSFLKDEYLSKCAMFPAIAKIKNGRSSKDVLYLNDRDDLKLSSLKKHDYIIQPFLDGDVFVIDVLKDLNSNTITHIARKELTRTSNGAGLTVEIVEDINIDEIIQVFSEKINFVGLINVELLFYKDEYYLMDVNPRASAGVIYSNYAGYNFIENCLRVFLNLPLTPVVKKVKKGLILTRKYLVLEKNINNGK